MTFTILTLGIIFIHGVILGMLESVRKLNRNIGEAPYYLQAVSFLSVIRAFKVNLWQYALIWAVMFTNIATNSFDIIEYQNVGIIYMVIHAVITLTATIAYFVSDRDVVNTHVTGFFIYLLMLFNIVAILYVFFVGFVIY